ncbi:hypothetical protein GCM10010954_21890 [Halobacillus andaensis]|uniref:Sulfotransferase domain-containing protein n=1 Tax=Halobacillus andaensis TaxID=1176239 RepID=A0A917B578_HALAA|nr:sulfotransferase [Halobacillus andaensis]MBP2004302.1 hypothetical protein [Halobacillus andaensis]GGF22687.1 hypothetical protein GCM10010954_21890 [Halobacillus andaensis]
MKNIISIHGAPRSGTSWLGQLFDSSPETVYKFQPLFSYKFKNRVLPHSTKGEIDQFFKELYVTKDVFLDQADKKKTGFYPSFKSKDYNPHSLVMKMVRYHYMIPSFLKHFENTKVVGIVRNPAAVMNSWRKAPREFLPEWDFEEQWYFGESKNLFRPEEWYGFNKWKELTNLFLYMESKYPKKFKVVRYENLVRDTNNVIDDLFEFASLTKNSQTNDFIGKSKSLHHEDVYSVFKGKKDIQEWERELPDNIINRIYTEVKDTRLHRFL